MTDSSYFSLDELRAAFRLVAPDDRTAARLVDVWHAAFRSYVVDDRIVELPESYERPRFEAQPTSGGAREVGPIHEYHDEMNSGFGPALIRFTDLTLTMLAGSSEEVRARFDRLHVPYAHGTLNDRVGWEQILDALRRQ
jgi:hypothetical protein